MVCQCLAAIAAGLRCWQMPEPASWTLLGWLMLSVAVAGIYKVDANVRSARITMAFTVTYLSFLLLGTSAAILVGLVGTISSFVVQVEGGRRRWSPRRLLTHQPLYNSANCLLSVAVMGLTYRALGGEFGELRVLEMAVPIIVSALAFYAVNTLGVTLAIGWSKGVNPFEVFRNHALWAWPGFLASASLSGSVLWAYQSLQTRGGTLLVLPILILVYYSYFVRSDKARAEVEHISQLNSLNDATISSLVMAIDAKDRHTHTHLNRVREYAIALAKALKVSADELQAVRIASLLHDIGKIGIPEHILCKPGKLTPEEFEIIKTHVEIGAAILEKVQFPWPVVPIVWTHHERWDGMGYPKNIKGEDIPIGGRIISVVDVYDALTSERPYRKAAPREKAVAILREAAGSQFDARVVEAFISILPEVEVRIQEMEAKLEAQLPHPEPMPVTPAEATTGHDWDEAEDAMVLSELVDLPLGTDDVASFAPLLAEKLKQLVPYTTFALYVNDGERHLVPAHVSGMWPELFDELEIRIGQGLSGFVARHGRPVVDGAILDLGRMMEPGQTLELSSALSVPLERDGQTLGTLTVYHGSYNFYQPYHVKRLTRVAQYAVEALQPNAPAPDRRAYAGRRSR